MTTNPKSATPWRSANSTRGSSANPGTIPLFFCGACVFKETEKMTALVLGLVHAHTELASIRRALTATCHFEQLVRAQSSLSSSFSARRCFVAWRRWHAAQRLRTRRHMSWARRLHRSEDPITLLF